MKNNTAQNFPLLKSVNIGETIFPSQTPYVTDALHVLYPQSASYIFIFILFIQ